MQPHLKNENEVYVKKISKGNMEQDDLRLIEWNHVSIKAE